MRLIRSGYVVISNMNESLGIPQNIIVTRNEVLEKYPDTSKRVLKAYIQGMQLAKFNKREVVKAGYDAGMQGEPDIVSAAWDLSLLARSHRRSVDRGAGHPTDARRGYPHRPG